MKSATDVVCNRLVDQLDYEPHSMGRINVARAVPSSLTQLHTTEADFGSEPNPW